MCGIVGLVLRDVAVDPSVLERAARCLERRGPDDAGVWAERGVGFGHRRLAVIDLSAAGHQPMISRDGRYVIVLNGEIYNYRDLRAELGEVAPWRSESDTEVVLAAYARWGPACLARFHGMYAFAIWDARERRLFAARDRMGVKPFYYHHSARAFGFASRPRALFAALPQLPATLDEQALRLYLESGYVPAPWSIHNAVRKLPPAHYLVLDDGGLRLERYWDFRGIEPERSWRGRGEGDLVDELEEIVSRSVRSRMVSDAPLGAFLSGGIDSSVVVAMMQRHSARPAETFTIGFDEPAFDESAHALAVARHLGTTHRSDRLRVDDLLELLPMFLAEFDEPFFDSSAFPVMAVSRLARRHVTVSLSGDGGDELFGGYHYYRIAHRLEAVFALPETARLMVAALARRLPLHAAKLLAGALRQDNPARAFAFARSTVKDFGAYLPQALVSRTTGLAPLFDDARRAFPAGLSAAETGMRLDAAYTLPDDYLQKVDLASMAYSLESRDPLLDQVLVEWAMRLPLEWKLKGRGGKYLLRQLAYRLVPRQLLERPKQGFEVPLAAWLRGPLKSWARERIEDAAPYRQVPLERAKVRALFDLHQTGARDAHPLLWAMLVLLDFGARMAPAAAD